MCLLLLLVLLSNLCSLADLVLLNCTDVSAAAAAAVTPMLLLAPCADGTWRPKGAASGSACPWFSVLCCTDLSAAAAAARSAVTPVQSG
jgi:hypothetical protein